jgi:hypothetical protein
LVLHEVARKVSWRGRASKLLNRIRKITKNKKFSVRDAKLLSKLANQQKKKGSINLEEISYYFPGKSLQMIEEEYEKIFESN